VFKHKKIQIQTQGKGVAVLHGHGRNDQSWEENGRKSGKRKKKGEAPPALRGDIKKALNRKTLARKKVNRRLLARSKKERLPG